MLWIHFVCTRQCELEEVKERREGDQLHRSKQEKMSGQERVTEGVGWGSHRENRQRLMLGEWMREY